MKGFSILELVFSLAITSIVAMLSFPFLKQAVFLQKEKLEKEQIFYKTQTVFAEIKQGIQTSQENYFEQTIQISPLENKIDFTDYSLLLDQNGTFRRRSHVSRENQPIVYNISNLEIRKNKISQYAELISVKVTIDKNSQTKLFFLGTHEEFS